MKVLVFWKNSFLNQPNTWINLSIQTINSFTVMSLSVSDSECYMGLRYFFKRIWFAFYLMNLIHFLMGNFLNIFFNCGDIGCRIWHQLAMSNWNRWRRVSLYWWKRVRSRSVTLKSMRICWEALRRAGHYLWMVMARMEREFMTKLGERLAINAGPVLLSFVVCFLFGLQFWSGF